MNYVIYDEEMKDAIKIVKEQPEDIKNGRLIATSNDLEVGDEFSHKIVIHEVTEDGV